MIIAEATISLPIVAYFLPVLVDITIYQIMLPSCRRGYNLNLIAFTGVDEIRVSGDKKSNITHSCSPLVAVSNDYTALFSGLQLGQVHLGNILKLPTHYRTEPAQ